MLNATQIEKDHNITDITVLLRPGIKCLTLLLDTANLDCITVIFRCANFELFVLQLVQLSLPCLWRCLDLDLDMHLHLN